MRWTKKSFFYGTSILQVLSELISELPKAKALEEGILGCSAWLRDKRENKMNDNVIDSLNNALYTDESAILDFQTPQSINPYTVERALIERKGELTPCYLVLRDGIPATAINKHLLVKQAKYAHPCSTPAYVIEDFLNTMDSYGLSIEEITRGNIYDYLSEAYVEDGKAYKTILSYITHIGDLFDDLQIHGFQLHPSLLTTDKHAFYVIRNKKAKRHITTIPLMRAEFIPNKNAALSSGMISYTKWYTKEQILAIQAELSPVYRCIFLDTVTTGHRVDSALSITLQSINMREHWIMPTRTKTGRNHRAFLPEFLSEQIYTYQIEDRAAIVRKTGTDSQFLFLGRNGKPVTYAAYRAALQTAAKKVRTIHPELGLTEVHTHAGRSTYAAALRSYQKSQQAKGIPTFTDDDFCKLMDWASMQCLDNYDILTRTQDLSPLVEKFQDGFFSFLDRSSLTPLEGSTCTKSK